MIKSIDKINLIGLAIIISALILSAYTREHPEISRYGQAVILSVISPILSLSSNADQFLSRKFGDYLLLVNTKKVNLELESRLKYVVDENLRLQQLAQENDHLRQLLDFKNQTSSAGRVANVIAYSAGQHHQLVVDRGKIDGVESGAAVVDGIGLVGMVITVSSKSAVVQLVNDRFTGIDALVEGKSVRGIVTGEGQRVLSFDFVTKDQKIFVGDKLVTSGLGGIYPPGLLIGLVSNVTPSTKDVLFQSIQVHPIINLEAVGKVMILDALPELSLAKDGTTEKMLKDRSQRQ